MQFNHHKSPTFVIRHRVHEKDRRAYEDWLKRIGRDATAFPGHLGAHITRPRPTDSYGEYTVAIRFYNETNLLAWANSKVRARHMEQIQHILLDGDRTEIHAGIDFWFTTPETTAPRAKPWKQFLVTLSAIYPLTMVIPALLKPIYSRLAILFSDTGFLLSTQLLAAACIVGLMVYVVMPRYTRMLGPWLYK